MISQHFIARARERIGPQVDPVQTGLSILQAIRHERNDLVTFVARVNRKGLRIFRFRVEDGRWFYALVDTEHMTLVTVMPPGFRTPRQGKGFVRLKEVDI